MKLLLILLSILANTLAFVVNNNPLSKPDIEGRITRGNNATDGQFPHQVGLLFYGGPPTRDWCGGSLISPEWVLTAAHCLMGISAATIYLGATEIRRQSEQTRYVTKENFIIHTGYNNYTFRDDIALIRIPSVNLTSKIQTIKIPSLFAKSHSTYSDTYAIASGWGKISDREQFVTTHLQWARFQIISNKDCRQIFSFTPNASLCVATPGFMSPCFGDSGGPLVSEEDGILIGAFSFLSIRGCELGFPAAYVRLTHYLDWIYYHTGILY